MKAEIQEVSDENGSPPYIRLVVRGETQLEVDHLRLFCRIRPHAIEADYGTALIMEVFEARPRNHDH